jgi:hypothetical protein
MVKSYRVSPLHPSIATILRDNCRTKRMQDFPGALVGMVIAKTSSLYPDKLPRSFIVLSIAFEFNKQRYRDGHSTVYSRDTLRVQSSQGASARRGETFGAQRSEPSDWKPKVPNCRTPGTQVSMHSPSTGAHSRAKAVTEAEWAAFIPSAS